MPRQHITGRQFVTSLTNASERLSQIPEEERQRLSHASRLNLDQAEQDLRAALELIRQEGLAA